MSMLRSFAEITADPIETRAGPVRLDASSERARRARRLGDPALRREIRKLLARKVPANQIDELTNTTLEESTKCEHVPDDDVMCRHYVCGVARHVAFHYWKREKRRLEAGAEALDAETRGTLPVGVEAVEAKLALDSAVGRADAGRRQAIGWYFRFVLGEPYAAIAGEELLPYRIVRDRADAAREWLRTQIMPACIAACVLLFLWAVARDMVIPGQDVAAPVELPRIEQPAPKPQPRGRVEDQAPKGGDASAVRARALVACDAKQWRECLLGLDDAKAIDPAGDQSSDVQKARARAQQAADAKAPRRDRGGEK